MADNRKLSALPIADTITGADLFYLVQGGLSKQVTGTTFITFAAETMQPAADNLSALAGLEGIAGKVPYFTGTGAMSTADSTSYGRGLLNTASGTALKAAIGLGSVANRITMAAPFTDGKVMEFTPEAEGLGSFYINYSETEFDPSGLPDPVMQWGYNIAQGGGAVMAGEPAIALQIEGHYDAGSSVYVEQHLLYLDRDGVQHRPWSWRIDTAADGSGLWDYLLHLTTLSARLKTADGLTDNPFFGVGGTSFFWLPGLDAGTGEPASGINLSGDNTQFTIGKIGGSMSLLFNGWTTVEFPGSIVFTGSTGAIQTPGPITADYLTFGPGSIGQLGNSATDIKLDCYSGADFILTMVGGAGISLSVDHVTGATALKALSTTGLASLGAGVAVTGAATISTTLGVSGLTTLSAGLNVTGTAAITGAATVSSTLGVSGLTTLGAGVNVTGTAAITGAATVSSTLAVTGKTTATGGVEFSNTTGTATVMKWYEQGSITPVVSFGGASVGITYTLQSGSFTRIGNRVLWNLRVTLSSKGSSTGAMVISGLPYSAGSSNLSPAALETLAMASMNTPQADTSGTTIRMLNFNGTTVGLATDANCTNTTQIIASGNYEVP